MDGSALLRAFQLLFQAHPWHGVSPGGAVPERVNCFIEIVPTDTVKYEVHKPSGHLHIDRPQRFSSMCPTLYGFIPQTYCGTRVAEACARSTGRSGIKGDGDPLDICVLTERPINQGSIFLTARPIGGLRMIDRQQADDKIIAILDNDLAYGEIENIDQLPQPLLSRLEHYFLSYKQFTDQPEHEVIIAEIYGRDAAFEVITESLGDYVDKFGDLRIASHNFAFKCGCFLLTRPLQFINHRMPHRCIYGPERMVSMVLDGKFSLSTQPPGSFFLFRNLKALSTTIPPRPYGID